jgi:hypothetical protein
VLGYLVAGLFFLRFWRQTHDRLFLIFSVSFWMLGIQRLLLGAAEPAPESRTGFYLIRLAAFLLILSAIVDKNRAK